MQQKTYIINNNFKNIKIYNTNESRYLPYKKTPHIEVKDYYTALESTILVPIVDPPKHSTFLL